MAKTLYELYNEQNFEEMAEKAKSMSFKELFAELNKLDKDALCHVLPKLPTDIAAMEFLLFSSELQKYLVENISDIDFKPLSEELLDIDGIEKKIDKDTFSTILIYAKADARHEKLLEIIDNIENKKFALLKPILSEMEPVDIAEILNDVDEEKVMLIFRLLPKDLASDVFVEMEGNIDEK